MMTGDAVDRTARRLVEVAGGVIEIFVSPMPAGQPIVCAAHPAALFTEAAADLLRDMARAGAVVANPRGIGRSSPVPPGGEAYGLDSMVDDLEDVRRSLGLGGWVFWGMSGGGWLSMAYARRHPEGLRGVIVESACSCFRLRLADPECILSPFHPSWRTALDARELIEAGSHDSIGDANATEWLEVDGVGSVFRRRNGPALLVSPMPVAPEMRAAMRLLWPIDLRAALPAIRTPALVIGGSADPITPLSHVQAVHGAIAGSSLLIVDGAGHVPTTARRSEVADAARSFLRHCAT